MKGRLYQIIFIFSLFLLSCTPGKEISFEVLQAAEFELPVENDSLLVLNLAYYPWVDTLSINVLNRVGKSEQYIIDTFVIASIFNGFFSVIDNSEIQWLTENQYYEIRGDRTENFLDALNIESVNYLCDEFKTSQIVALEYYGFDFEYDYREIDESHYVVLDFLRFMVWRIYQRDMGLIYKDIVRDTVNWIGYGINYAMAEDQLPGLLDAIKEAFWFAGESFAKKISPYWQEEVRNYYFMPVQGTSDMSLDMDYLTRISSKDKSRKGKIFKTYYNLAVVNEKEGNIEEAIETLRKAAVIRPNSKLVKSYMENLEKSLKRRDKVLQQISE
ncbi:MAG: tetratricopeptide repeat protein [Bacteroidales bacterium]|nr:tetratricopeptide repeat protein [Bacteroidales bacterium]MCF8392170.1 tetratricopeptide repeat protein [Bacteroidales bacterium]